MSWRNGKVMVFMFGFVLVGLFMGKFLLTKGEADESLDIIISGIQYQESLVKSGEIEIAGKYYLSGFWLKKFGKNMVDPFPEREVRYSWKFDNNKLFLQEKTISPPEAAQKCLDVYTVFDGTTMTRFDTRIKEAVLSGYDPHMIGGNAAPPFQSLCLSISLGDSVSQAIKKGKTRLVGKEIIDGEINYVLEIESPSTIQKIYVIPSKGYRVKKILGSAGRNTWLDEVTEFKDYGEGIWFPVKSHEVQWTETDKGEKQQLQESWIEVKSLSLNVKIPDSVFKIELPPGTMVNDVNVGISYQLGGELR